jgi:predicted HicB family RNase H-like nuclease
VVLTVGSDQQPGEVARDQRGNIIDDDYVDTVLQEINVAKAPPGRPSLAEGTSPLVQFRIPREVKAEIDEAARARGVSTSQWLREAVENELHHHAS